MTSRAPQTKPAAPSRAAKKLGASMHPSRETRSGAVQPTARNLLKSSPMRGFRSSDPRSRRPAPAEESSSRPANTLSPSPTLSSRKAAMSNKTAPAKDTTEEYREDSVENTAVRRSPKGVSESGSEDGPEEAADVSADAGGFASEAPAAGVVDGSSDSMLSRYFREMATHQVMGPD